MDIRSSSLSRDGDELSSEKVDESLVVIVSERFVIRCTIRGDLTVHILKYQKFL